MHLFLSIAPYLFIALIGVSLGSFYRALGDRILYYFYGKGRKVEVKEKGTKQEGGTIRRTMPASKRWKLLFTHPSSCSHCGGRISISRLIPVLGWFIARGRCEHREQCRARISVWHPITEALFAALGVFFLHYSQNAVAALILLLFCGHLLVAMVTDWNRLTLDYENTAVLLLLSVIAVYLLEGYSSMPMRLAAGFGVLGFFFVSHIVTKGRQPGFGDILLGAVLGFHHGFPWLLLPLQIGAAGSLLHLWLINRNMRSAAPLGFYMAVGSVVTTVVTMALTSVLL